ncbi:MAG: hypothetical protein EBY49_03525 [Actinobacteria bacterium]|nr:hypothetical protein [Actinomycetota bacterium]
MPRWLNADAPELAEHDDLDLVWAAIEPIDDPALAGERRRMRELLDTRPDPLKRHERPGHFTGSALVVHADLERTLVLFHTKLVRPEELEALGADAGLQRLAVAGLSVARANI